MKLLITGGYGFIGSCFIRKTFAETNFSIINIDSLTYASNSSALGEGIINSDRYKFYQVDIGDKKKIFDIFKIEKPNRIVNFAAESHVDNSVKNPEIFLKTNILGTFNLLEGIRAHHPSAQMIHISTDEVYGDLSLNDQPFTEENQINPSSPYSASKAASDHLVSSWARTYNLNYLITNCSNNYGPFQDSEKLIPTIIEKLKKNQKIPIYGNGMQIRDWLYVEDHVDAILGLISKEIKNERVNIGGKSEVTNLELAKLICDKYDSINRKNSDKNSNSYENLIEHVEDRPGHDKRYAINFNKLTNLISWKPAHSLDQGLNKTINWYLQN